MTCYLAVDGRIRKKKKNILTRVSVFYLFASDTVCVTYFSKFILLGEF